MGKWEYGVRIEVPGEKAYVLTGEQPMSKKEAEANMLGHDDQLVRRRKTKWEKA